MELLEGKGIDVIRFIRHYWLSTTQFVREKALYKSIKKNTTDYAGFLDLLSRESKVYATFTNPNIGDWRRFANSFSRIRTLELLKATQYQTLLLSVLRAYDANKITKK